MPSGGGDGDGDGDGDGGGDGAALHLSSQVLFKYVPLLLSRTHFLSLHVYLERACGFFWGATPRHTFCVSLQLTQNGATGRPALLYR